MRRGARRVTEPAAVAVVGLTLAGMAWALYRPALRLWWSDDDFFCIRLLSAFRPAQLVLDPAAWAHLPRMVTPLLFLSLGLDLRAFGLDPHGAYLHQLAALTFCALSLYAALRLWLPALWSALAAGLFLLGPPVASLALILTSRHYPEAIALAALAVLSYGLALRRDSTGWALASAALYLMATLAKEIVLPLPLVLPLLPRPSLAPRERNVEPRLWVRFAAPHAAALALYVAYRRAVLGVWVGGYGWTVAPGDWPRLALALPVRIAREVAAGTVPGWVLVAALGAGLLLLSLRRPSAVPLLAVALLSTTVPVLPVSLAMAPRYAVPAWTAASLALVFAIFDLASARSPAPAPAGWYRTSLWGAVLLAGATAICALAANRAAWAAGFAAMERKSAENLAFLDLRPGDFLRRPLEVPAALYELTALRHDRMGRGPGGSWFADDLFLCVALPPGARVWSFDDASRRVVVITARLPALAASYCGAIRQQAPLTAEIRSDGQEVSWQLGPYRHGRYALVMRDGIEAIDVPRVGGYQRRGVTRLEFRVRYEAPAGWVTYSPRLALDFSRAPVARWARPAGAPDRPL
jgi:hypothetical protein